MSAVISNKYVYLFDSFEFELISGLIVDKIHIYL